MVDTIYHLDLFQIPSEQILRNRQTFYGLLRKSDNETSNWLKQVQNCIRHCEYPKIIMEFLLIDRFICGLNTSELKIIQGASQYWTLKQLLEHILDENIDDIGHIVTNNSAANENVNQLDVVKTEPVGLSLIQIIPLFKIRFFLFFIAKICILFNYL